MIHFRFVLVVLMMLAFNFVAVGSVPTAQAAVSDPDEQLQNALTREGMSGIVWGQLDGEKISTGALGTSNGSTDVALRPNARVHVGSIAKTVMALGVLRLVSEGRLGLDDPVESLLPTIKFDNRWQRTNPVTVRHLLDHTAGLEDARLWHVFSAEVGSDYPLQSIALRNPSILRIRTQPGETFSYSNIGYSLIGMIVERITQVRYEKYLDREILAPLGMASSTTQFTTQERPTPDPNLAWGHNDDGSTVAAMPIAVRAAGQLTSTSRDMALLAKFLMGDGNAGGVRIVSEKLLSDMARPRHAAAKAGLVNGYALGLGHFDRAGQSGKCHGGDIIGFRAMLCLYPDQKKAYFRAINIDKEGANYRQFDEILITSLQLALSTRTTSIPLGSETGEWVGYYVPLVSRFAISRYAEMLTEGFQFRLRRDGAEIVQDDGKVIKLDGVGPNLLRAEDRARPSHVLHQNSIGKKRISTDMRTFRQTHWLERPGLWIGLITGVCGLLYLVFIAPIIAWRTKRKRAMPVHFVLAGGMAAGLLIFLQPFQSLGDATTGSVLLAIVTVSVPIALICHGIAAFRSDHPGHRFEVIACLATLQWIGTLAAFDLVPLLLWN